MGTYRLATSRQVRNPVRVQQWNASIRAGDDFKLALTVYDDDDGTLTLLPGSRSRLALYREHGYGHGWGFGSGLGYCCDYGWDWYTGPRTPAQQVDGYVAGTAWPGQVNFSLPGASTAALHGNYRMLLELDMYNGGFTQIEGVLQFRGGITNTLGHAAPVVFTLDQSLLDGPDILQGILNDGGLAVDADGFLLNPDITGLVLPSGIVTAAALPGFAALLPTVMPTGPGVLWNNAGVLTVS
jgi:hypothetical protein